jgi:hypothetical protein
MNYRNSGKMGLMNLRKNPQGYARTELILNGLRKGVKLHRLVAEYFIPNPGMKKHVNHIDFNRSNNCVENLEWTTPKENFWHSAKEGRMDKFLNSMGKNKQHLVHGKGEACLHAKITEKQVIEIRKKFKPYKYTKKMLAKEYKITEHAISDIIFRKSWKHVK